MDWLKIARSAYIIFLFSLILYVALFMRAHPTHFVYLSSGTNNYKGGEPILDCTHKYSNRVASPFEKIDEVYVNGCLVKNVPFGSKNIYVKESNPFIYWTIQNQWICNITLFGLFGLLFWRSFVEKVKKLTKDLENTKI